MKYFQRILMAVLLGYLTGVTVTSIGQPFVNAKPYETACNAVAALLFFGSLALVCYLAGKESERS